MRKGIACPSEINFSIVKEVDNPKRHDNIYSEISDKLIYFKNDNVQWTVQRASESDSIREQQLQDLTDGDENIQDMDESAKSRDFFHDNNATFGKRYTTIRIKSRNFLSNIAYVGINKEDYYESFIFDVYLVMAENLNPFFFG